MGEVRLPLFALCDDRIGKRNLGHTIVDDGDLTRLFRRTAKGDAGGGGEINFGGSIATEDNSTQLIVRQSIQVCTEV